MERLCKLVRQFTGNPRSREFRTWKDDLMRAFILSDIKSPNDQVTTLPHYYHSLMKHVQGDEDESMRVLGERFDCI